MNAIKIIRIIAIVLVVIAAFVEIPYAAAVLALLGLAIGFMGVSEDRRILFLVTAVAIASAAGSLGSIPAVGGYLTAILTNVSAVYAAGAVAVILMIVKDRVSE